MSPFPRFWVEGKGWTAVNQLQPGDLLRGVDGQLYPVEAVTATDEWLPVYNARIADYHTYYVCAPDGNVWLWAHNACRVGRSGKQAKLHQIMHDPNAPRRVRGWLRQEAKAISNGKRHQMRVPPGYELAHRRGFEARKGFGYEHTVLQGIDLHKLQHKVGGYRPSVPRVPKVPL